MGRGFLEEGSGRLSGGQWGQGWAAQAGTAWQGWGGGGGREAGPAPPSTWRRSEHLPWPPQAASLPGQTELAAAGQMEWYLGQGLVHSRCSSVLMALLEPRGVPPPLGLGSYLFTFLRYLHFSSVK